MNYGFFSFDLWEFFFELGIMFVGFSSLSDGELLK